LTSLQRTKEERKMLMEYHQDVANKAHQFHHRVQLSHKASTVKYKSPKIPLVDGWTMPKGNQPSSFSWESPVLLLE
jgi:hypothetical protein